MLKNSLSGQTRRFGVTHAKQKQETYSTDSTKMGRILSEKEFFNGIADKQTLAPT
jgi:hypothetical protein